MEKMLELRLRFYPENETEEITLAKHNSNDDIIVVRQGEDTIYLPKAYAGAVAESILTWISIGGTAA
ncbi:hypothetical protein [Limoniibacter endophyticus]|uniref:Uncharacterized protein n=2 Tax=Limoniibacter endophyticus TaxID=1565040 RepID=A0A8J3GEM5_9HYPH|nr:hypothetical protein [Limoniibacter endophyticus]GHC61342.1 hypothetical protein GCM10010136_01830 [Limoniibacter endophyticus]